MAKNIYGPPMAKNIYGPPMARNIYGPLMAKIFKNISRRKWTKFLKMEATRQVNKSKT